MGRPNVDINIHGPQAPVTPYKNLTELTEEVSEIRQSIDRHSDTRPALTEDNVGYMMFDEVLGKPIWWNGASWVDALGNPVDTEYQIVEETNEQTE